MVSAAAAGGRSYGNQQRQPAAGLMSPYRGWPRGPKALAAGVAFVARAAPPVRRWWATHLVHAATHRPRGATQPRARRWVLGCLLYSLFCSLCCVLPL